MEEQNDTLSNKIKDLQLAFEDLKITLIEEIVMILRKIKKGGN